MIIDFVTMQTKRSKSYLKIITTAKKLFWKHGSSRVTIEELCREAGVSKMTFYRHFNNKNEIIGKFWRWSLKKDARVPWNNGFGNII
ncbi:MAG: helix-turn-helix transcriptional regulator [Saprospiraceae bacterium]|nr:helix-turn-helix transcriptional regulator [Saprospiraceae bacterium]